MIKVALTAFDTKRWIEEDNINTLAHGHYSTLYSEFMSYLKNSDDDSTNQYLYSLITHDH